MNITRFKDIPQFTSSGSYQVNYPLTSLVREIEEEVSEMGLQLNPEFQRGHGLSIIFVEESLEIQFI